VDAAPPYLVAIDPDRRVVQAWSTKRLPFEPRGYLFSLRAELRSALKRLRANTGGVLSALYGSPAPGFCDPENVLIYNVGASHLSGAADWGLRIERSYGCPSPPEPLEAPAEHYWRYRVAPAAEDFSTWREERPLAMWSHVPMPALTDTPKPASIWYALRCAAIDVGLAADPSKPFGLRLTLGLAPGEHAAPAKVVKPLVDGVVAALHSHDRTDLVEVSRRVQAQLPTQSPERIAALLGAGRPAVLGRRRLLWPRANGVQWHPADDLCLALELRLERSDRRELSGRLVEITAR
jgi:hypothetical protein